MNLLRKMVGEIKFKSTFIENLYVIELETIEDTRGYFSRAWCKKEFQDFNLDNSLAQCNLSYNYKKGTIRGLHYQKEPFSEVKLVRCVKGKIFDVAVDLREESKTYGKWFGIELSDKNGKALYIPKGFAHGYETLEDDSIVFYQVSEYYTPNSEGGILWSDDILEIDWPIKDNIIISDKDQKLPCINEIDL